MPDPPPPLQTQEPESTSPTAPEFAVTAERLASLKSRLQAISVKHASRRTSQDFSSLSNSPRQSLSGESPTTVPMHRSPSETSFSGSMGSSTLLAGEEASRSGRGSENQLAGGGYNSEPELMSDDGASIKDQRRPSIHQVAGREPCRCKGVLNDDDPTTCGTCNGVLTPVARLEKERARLAARLVEEKQKVRAMEQRQDASTHEMAALRTKAHQFEEAVAQKDAELAIIRADLDRIGQKLVDEVEVRAELQHSKDAVQEELEELTRSLFEEANTMVATEARSRHELAQRESNLRVKMLEMEAQLQMERDQLKELRARMQRMESDFGSSMNLVDPGRLSAQSSNNSVEGAAARESHGAGAGNNGPAPEEAIDSVLFAEFEDFMTASPDVRLAKMHALPFMKNALEDDVSPCLRFGGNPRTSTKRLIDAITANTCFVEEINPAQLANLEARRNRTDSAPGTPRAASVSPSRESSQIGGRRAADSHDDYLSGPGNAAASPVTQPKSAGSNAIFNKTVMERLSNAFSSGTMSLSNSNASLSSVLNSCSACGRAAPPPQSSSSAASSTTGHHLSAQPLQPPQPPPVSNPIRFQFRTSDSPEDSWNPICQQCRDRLVAVCEFYNFARHVRQGLYSTRRPQDLYLEVLTMKRRMFYARIGAARFADGDKSFVRRKPRPNSSLLSPASGSHPQLAGTPSGVSPPPLTVAPGEVINALPRAPVRTASSGATATVLPSDEDGKTSS
ncbi:rab guanine nucleotide exchange factor S2 [Geranomyces variabilis]|uniref:Rab guanine nucleotide exchange factor S2 n=1 Tax=Geranomyces variabilis TaxID=109894 RepID=A0AAD5TIT2_9FUNG|nr:rab guanine nucleotide exchange factor S2 [Geranomyces variabilis]